jgi:hypothetical protein
MRKLLALLCALLCLNACKKNADSVPVTPALLSGTWLVQTAITMTYTNGMLSNTTKIVNNTTDPGFGNPIVALYFSTNLSGTYLPPGLAGVPFTYTINGDQLTYNYGDATDLTTNFTVKSLTNTQLELVDGSPSGNGAVHDNIYVKEN